MWRAVVVLVYILKSVRPQGNHLQNGDFENPNSINPWICMGCKTVVTQDSYEGHWCVMVTRRDRSWSALTQTVYSQGDRNFIFKAHIKLLSVGSGKFYTTINVLVQHVDENGKLIKTRFVVSPKQQVSFDWIEVGGDVYIPDISHVGSFSLSIEIPEYEVDYLVDSAVLTDMPKNPSWKSAAIAAIDRIRKASLTITPDARHSNPFYCSRYGGSYCIDISQMYVEIKQTRSEYAFGSSVYPDLLSGSLANPTYDQFVFKNFEWGLINEELQWNKMESVQGIMHANITREAIEVLRSNRIKAWGSGLFSALRTNNPDWLKLLSLWDVQKAIQNRFDTIASEFNNSFDNLDVYSDYLLDDYMETITRTTNITEQLFKTAHEKFPTARLFLDESNVLNSSIHTTAYSILAKRLQKSHIPVHGLGIRAHFNTTEIDMDVIKYRLDKLVEARLPIWISSLAIHDANVTRRAEHLEDIMYLLFSYPEVEGMILDGVWDRDLLNRDSALAQGFNFQMNEAGQVYVNRWHTHENLSFSSTVSIRAYKGE